MPLDGLQSQVMFVGLEVKVDRRWTIFFWKESLCRSLGLCEIEQTEKGWYVTLIDKDADSVQREMDAEKKEKMDLDDEQRRQKLIAEQVC